MDCINKFYRRLVIFSGIMIGITVGHCRNESKLKEQEAFNRMLNTGITHQYIDTNRNGKYDLYRFIQKGSETIYSDTNGDGYFDSAKTIDKSRFYTSNLSKELSKQKCEREYRLGRIEFISF